MAVEFQSTITARIGWKWTDDAGPKYVDSVSHEKTLIDGWGENQAEAVWQVDSATLTDGNDTTYDLMALAWSLFDESLTLTFETIKAVLIVNESTAAGAGDLIVGDAASNEWSAPFGADGDTVDVPPDSPCLLCNRQWGWLVDASNKDLKVAASGGDVTYSIAIVGTTTADASGSGDS